MLDRTRQPALAVSWMTGHETMSADGDADRARRFREAALRHLDDVYTLARYLMRNAADADDAVQECYLRAASFRQLAYSSSLPLAFLFDQFDFPFAEPDAVSKSFNDFTEACARHWDIKASLDGK